MMGEGAKAGNRNGAPVASRPSLVGSGLYGILLFAVLAVFIVGLTVGHTPEYPARKSRPRKSRERCAPS